MPILEWPTHEAFESESMDMPYQRGQRRKGLLEKVQDVETWKSDFLACKNLTLAQLIYFYLKQSKDGRLTPESTCYDVIEKIIKPDTKAENCCYMDTVMGGAKKADCMVSHWWGQTFKDVVLAIARYATGIQNPATVEKKTFSAGIAHSDLEKSFWMCMFAANHHAKDRPGHALADMDTLQRVISSMGSMLVVLDTDLKVLSRAWCVVEVYEAALVGKKISFAGNFTDHKILKGLTIPGLDDCETSEMGDRARLVAHYDFNIGINNFNQQAQEILFNGVLNEVWGMVVRSRSVDAMADLLQRRADVNGSVTKQRDTALTWACQYNGNVSVLEMLLEARADVNAHGTGEWSALHFAAQMGNDDFVAGLLAAGADACAVAQNGRTPLLEAAEREYRSIVERLLEANADPFATDIQGAAPVHFASNFDSAELIQRMGWKMGMRQSRIR